MTLEKGLRKHFPQSLFIVNRQGIIDSIHSFVLKYKWSSKVNGLNLYAYCNNNPVMGVDPKAKVILGNLLSFSPVMKRILAFIGT